MLRSEHINLGLHAARSFVDSQPAVGEDQAQNPVGVGSTSLDRASQIVLSVAVQAQQRCLANVEWN